MNTIDERCAAYETVAEAIRFIRGHTREQPTLDEIAGHYWGGTLVEEISLRFHEERWREPAVIEALFVGRLATHS